MIFVLASYAAWGPAIIGLGSVTFHFWPKHRDNSDPAGVLWLLVAGFALLASISTTINFFTPMTAEIDLALLALGWVLLGINVRPIASTAARSWPGPLWTLPVALVATMGWMAVVAVKLPLLYDTGLYHLQAIKWMTESQLPFGLTNLHGRFGFNSAWFSAAAAMEIPGLRGRSSFVIDSLLFGAFGIAIISALMSVVQRGLRKPELFLASGGILWLWFGRWEFLGSPSPEVPALVLGVLTMYSAIMAVENPDSSSYYASLSFATAVFAVAVKLSSAPMLLAPMAALAWLHRSRRRGGIAMPGLKSAMAVSVLAGIVILVPWVARGLALSGYVAYPLTATRLGFLPWAATVNQGTVENAWIMSWARHPGAQPDQVLGKLDWIPEWIDRFRFNDITAVLARMTAAGLALMLVGGRLKPSLTALGIYLIPAATAIAGLVFWFVTAPDLRFGMASFWTIASVSLAAGLWGIQEATSALSSTPARARLVPGLAVLLLAYSATADLETGFRFGDLRPGDLTAWPAMKSAQTVEKATTEGVKILTVDPKKSDQCWNANLPCTPYWADLVVERDSAGHFRSFKVRE